MTSSEYEKLLKNATKLTLGKSAKSVDKQVLNAYTIAAQQLMKKFKASKEGSATRAYYASYMRSLYTQINDIITEHGLKISQEIAMMQSFMLTKQFEAAGITGINFNLHFGKIDKEVIRDFMGGNIYKNGKGLSEMIWGNAVKAGADIQSVVAAGLSQNMSATALAKQLEEYVDPNAATRFKAGKITGISGKLEYNSLRLARTTLTHMATLSLKKSCAKNPFIEGLKWHTSDTHLKRMHGKRDICDIYAEQNKFKMGPGVYPIDKCPFDHPNGLCHQTAYIPKSLDEIGDELRDWCNGKENARMDKWAKLNPGLFNEVAKRIPATAVTAIRERVKAIPAIEKTEYKIITKDAVEQSIMNKVPDSAVERLYGNQKLSEYMNAEDLSVFENNIIEYTAGGVEIEELDDYFKTQVLGLIKNNKTVSHDLYRVEESKYIGNLEIGDVFERDIQSWSKSKGWLDETMAGNSDVEYQNPAMFIIKGEHKELNVQGYSYFGYQEESLMFGRYEVTNIEINASGQKIITLKVIDQLDVADKLMKEELKTIAAERAKELTPEQIKAAMDIGIDPDYIEEWSDITEMDPDLILDDDIINLDDMDIDWLQDPVVIPTTVKLSDKEFLYKEIEDMKIRPEDPTNEYLKSPFEVDKDQGVFATYESLFDKWEEIDHNSTITTIPLDELKKIDGVGYYWESELKEIADIITEPDFVYDADFHASHVYKINDKFYLVGNDNYAFLDVLKGEYETPVKLFDYDAWNAEKIKDLTYEELANKLYSEFPTLSDKIDGLYWELQNKGINPFPDIVEKLNQLSSSYSLNGMSASASELKQYAKQYEVLMNKWVAPPIDYTKLETIEDFVNVVKNKVGPVIKKKIEVTYNNAVNMKQNPYEKLATYFDKKALAYAESNEFELSDLMENLNLAATAQKDKYAIPEVAKFIENPKTMEEIISNFDSLSDVSNTQFYIQYYNGKNNPIAGMLRYLEGDLDDKYVNAEDKAILKKIYDQIKEITQPAKPVEMELTTALIKDSLKDNMNVKTSILVKKEIEKNANNGINPYSGIIEIIEKEMDKMIQNGWMTSPEITETGKLIDKIKQASVAWEKQNNSNLDIFQQLGLFYEDVKNKMGSYLVDELEEIFADGVAKNKNPLQEMLDLLKDTQNTNEMLKTISPEGYLETKPKIEQLIKDFEALTHGYIKDPKTGANIPLVTITGNGGTTYHFGFGNALSSVNFKGGTINQTAPKVSSVIKPVGVVDDQTKFDEIFLYAKQSNKDGLSSLPYDLKNAYENAKDLKKNPYDGMIAAVEYDISALNGAYNAGVFTTVEYKKIYDSNQMIKKLITDNFGPTKIEKKLDAAEILDSCNAILDEVAKIYNDNTKNSVLKAFNKGLEKGQNPYEALISSLDDLKEVAKFASGEGSEKYNLTIRLLNKAKALSGEYEVVTTGKTAEVVLKSFDELKIEAENIFGSIGKTMFDKKFDAAIDAGVNPYEEVAKYVDAKIWDFELNIIEDYVTPAQKIKIQDKIDKAKALLNDVEKLEKDFAEKVKNQIKLATPINSVKSFDEMLAQLASDGNDGIYNHIEMYKDYYENALDAGVDAYETVLDLVKQDLDFLKDMSAPKNVQNYNAILKFEKSINKAMSNTVEEVKEAAITLDKVAAEKKMQEVVDLLEENTNIYIAEEIEEILNDAYKAGKNPFEEAMKISKSKEDYYNDVMWDFEYGSDNYSMYEAYASGVANSIPKMKKYAKEWEDELAKLKIAVSKSSNPSEVLDKKMFENFSKQAEFFDNEFSDSILKTFQTSLENGTNPYSDLINEIQKLYQKTPDNKKGILMVLQGNVEDAEWLWKKSPEEVKAQFFGKMKGNIYLENKQALINAYENLFKESVVKGLNPYTEMFTKYNQDSSKWEDIVENLFDEFDDFEVTNAENILDAFTEVFENIGVLQKSYVAPPKPMKLEDILSMTEKKLSYAVKYKFQSTYDEAIVKGLNPYTEILKDCKTKQELYLLLGNSGKFEAIKEIAKEFEKAESFYIKPKPKPKSYKPASQIPDAEELDFLQDGGYLGGAGQKYIYHADSTDMKYIFKPAANKDGSVAEFKAYIQEAASDIQKIINSKSAIDIKAMDIDGIFGTLQPLLDTDALTFGSTLTQEQIIALQREHVVDWLIGNFDSHQANFIKSEGKIFGIDKEQAFKYINDEGSKSMSYTYHPNAQYGENEPIYNKLFKDYANGLIDMDLHETYKYIESIELIPDEAYKNIFREYAEGLYGPGDRAEELLDKILDKKKNLLTDYEEFFSELESERIGQNVFFEFDIENYGTKVDYEKFRFIGQQDGIGTNNSEKNIIRDSEILMRINDENYNKITPLNNYTGHDYDAFNEWMRQGRNASERVKRECAELTKFINDLDTPLLEDTKFLRHNPRSVMKHIFGNEVQALADKVFETSNLETRNKIAEEIEGIIKGTTYIDKGFISTSYKPGVFVETHGIEFQMYVPKGFNRGVFAEQFSDHEGEAEFIINSGQEFRVLEVTHEKIVGSGGWGTESNIVIKVVPINLE